MSLNDDAMSTNDDDVPPQPPGVNRNPSAHSIEASQIALTTPATPSEASLMKPPGKGRRPSSFSIEASNRASIQFPTAGINTNIDRSKSGVGLKLNSRVEVYFEESKQWFQGKLDECDENDGNAHFVSDDGHHEKWISLVGIETSDVVREIQDERKEKESKPEVDVQLSKPPGKPRRPSTLSVEASKRASAIAPTELLKSKISIQKLNSHISFPPIPPSLHGNESDEKKSEAPQNLKHNSFAIVRPTSNFTVNHNHIHGALPPRVPSHDSKDEVDVAKEGTVRYNSHLTNFMHVIASGVALHAASKGSTENGHDKARTSSVFNTRNTKDDTNAVPAGFLYKDESAFAQFKKLDRYKALQDKFKAKASSFAITQSKGNLPELIATVMKSLLCDPTTMEGLESEECLKLLEWEATLETAREFSLRFSQSSLPKCTTQLFTHSLRAIMACRVLWSKEKVPVDSEIFSGTSNEMCFIAAKAAISIMIEYSFDHPWNRNKSVMREYDEDLKLAKVAALAGVAIGEIAGLASAVISEMVSTIGCKIICHVICKRYKGSPRCTEKVDLFQILATRIGVLSTTFALEAGMSKKGALCHGTLASCEAICSIFGTSPYCIDAAASSMIGACRTTLGSRRKAWKCGVNASVQSLALSLAHQAFLFSNDNLAAKKPSDVSNLLSKSLRLLGMSANSCDFRAAFESTRACVYVFLLQSELNRMDKNGESEEKKDDRRENVDLHKSMEQKIPKIFQKTRAIAMTASGACHGIHLMLRIRQGVCGTAAAGVQFAMERGETTANAALFAITLSRGICRSKFSGKAEKYEKEFYRAAAAAICRQVAIVTVQRSLLPSKDGYSKIAAETMLAATALLPQHDHSATTVAGVASIGAVSDFLVLHDASMDEADEAAKCIAEASGMKNEEIMTLCHQLMSRGFRMQGKTFEFDVESGKFITTKDDSDGMDGEIWNWMNDNIMEKTLFFLTSVGLHAIIKLQSLYRRRLAIREKYRLRREKVGRKAFHYTGESSLAMDIFNSKTILEGFTKKAADRAEERKRKREHKRRVLEKLRQQEVARDHKRDEEHLKEAKYQQKLQESLKEKQKHETALSAAEEELSRLSLIARQFKEDDPYTKERHDVLERLRETRDLVEYEKKMVKQIETAIVKQKEKYIRENYICDLSQVSESLKRLNLQMKFKILPEDELLLDHLDKLLFNGPRPCGNLLDELKSIYQDAKSIPPKCIVNQEKFYAWLENQEDIKLNGMMVSLATDEEREQNLKNRHVREMQKMKTEWEMLDAQEKANKKYTEECLKAIEDAREAERQKHFQAEAEFERKKHIKRLEHRVSVLEDHKRRAEAAEKIQSLKRKVDAQKAVFFRERAIMQVQSGIRGMIARIQVRPHRVLRNRAANKIQCHWRGYVTRKWFDRRMLPRLREQRRKKALENRETMKLENLVLEESFAKETEEARLRLLMEAEEATANRAMLSHMIEKLEEVRVTELKNQLSGVGASREASKEAQERYASLVKLIGTKSKNQNDAIDAMISDFENEKIKLLQRVEDLQQREKDLEEKEMEHEVLMMGLDKWRKIEVGIMKGQKKRIIQMKKVGEASAEERAVLINLIDSEANVEKIRSEKQFLRIKLDLHMKKDPYRKRNMSEESIPEKHIREVLRSSKERFTKRKVELKQFRDSSYALQTELIKAIMKKEHNYMIVLENGLARESVDAAFLHDEIKIEKEVIETLHAELKDLRNAIKRDEWRLSKLRELKAISDLHLAEEEIAKQREHFLKEMQEEEKKNIQKDIEEKAKVEEELREAEKEQKRLEDEAADLEVRKSERHEERLRTEAAIQKIQSYIDEDQSLLTLQNKDEMYDDIIGTDEDLKTQKQRATLLDQLEQLQDVKDHMPFTVKLASGRNITVRHSKVGNREITDSRECHNTSNDDEEINEEDTVSLHLDENLEHALSKAHERFEETKGETTSNRISDLLHYLWRIYSPSGQPVSDKEAAQVEMNILQMFLENGDDLLDFDFEDFELAFRHQVVELQVARKKRQRAVKMKVFAFKEADGHEDILKGCQNESSKCMDALHDAMTRLRSATDLRDTAYRIANAAIDVSEPLERKVDIAMKRARVVGSKTGLVENEAKLSLVRERARTARHEADAAIEAASHAEKASSTAANEALNHLQKALLSAGEVLKHSSARKLRLTKHLENISKGAVAKELEEDGELQSAMKHFGKEITKCHLIAQKAKSNLQMLEKVRSQILNTKNTSPFVRRQVKTTERLVNDLDIDNVPPPAPPLKDDKKKVVKRKESTKDALLAVREETKKNILKSRENPLLYAMYKEKLDRLDKLDDLQTIAKMRTVTDNALKKEKLGELIRTDVLALRSLDFDIKNEKKRITEKKTLAEKKTFVEKKEIESKSLHPDKKDAIHNYLKRMGVEKAEKLIEQLAKIKLSPRKGKNGKIVLEGLPQIDDYGYLIPSSNDDIALSLLFEIRRALYNVKRASLALVMESYEDGSVTSRLFFDALKKKGIEVTKREAKERLYNLLLFENGNNPLTKKDILRFFYKDSKWLMRNSKKVKKTSLTTNEEVDKKRIMEKSRFFHLSSKDLVDLLWRVFMFYCFSEKFCSYLSQTRWMKFCEDCHIIPRLKISEDYKGEYDTLLTRDVSTDIFVKYGSNKKGGDKNTISSKKEGLSFSDFINLLNHLANYMDMDNDTGSNIDNESRVMAFLNMYVIPINRAKRQAIPLNVHAMLQDKKVSKLFDDINTQNLLEWFVAEYSTDERGKPTMKLSFENFYQFASDTHLLDLLPKRVLATCFANTLPLPFDGAPQIEEITMKGFKEVLMRLALKLYDATPMTQAVESIGKIAALLQFIVSTNGPSLDVREGKGEIKPDSPHNHAGRGMFGLNTVERREKLSNRIAQYEIHKG
eukprot:g3161.t1